MLIQNNDRFVQPVYFDGMEIGKIHPTDIDSFIEYHNVLFVFWELKEQGKDFEQVRGQFTALVRTVDRIEKGGGKAVLYVCEHNVPKDKPIHLADTIVVKAYWQGEWITPNKTTTAKDAFFHAIDWANRFEQWERQNK